MATEGRESLQKTTGPDGEVDFTDSGASGENEFSPKGRRSRLGLFLGIPACLLVALYAFNAWRYASTHVSTDDAYITTDVVPINARESGIVQEILVADNEAVKPGQLLIRLDDSTYSAELAEAEANLAVAKAAAGGAGADVAIAEQTGAGQVAQAQSAVQVESNNVAAAQAAVNQALSGVAASQATVRTSEADAAAASETVRARRAAATRAAEMVKSARAQVSTAEAGVRAAEAAVTSAEATSANASRDAERARSLVASGAIAQSLADARETTASTAAAAADAARQQLLIARSVVDQKRSDLAAAQDQAREAQLGISQAQAMLRSAKQVVAVRSAQVNQAQTSVTASRQGVGAAEARRQQALGKLKEALAAPKRTNVSQANRASALAKVQQASAALQAAKIAMDHTRVTAPVAGVVTRRTAQVGQQLAPGQPLMVLLPSRRPWVVANFKETQLGQIRPGLTVEIHVDAVPGITFLGHVDSISSGTGSTFALLPPDNASGNFTKVVQRVPVKVTLDEQPHLDKLRAGLSSTVSIALRD